MKSSNICTLINYRNNLVSRYAAYTLFRIAHVNPSDKKICVFCLLGWFFWLKPQTRLAARIFSRFSSYWWSIFWRSWSAEITWDRDSIVKNTAAISWHKDKHLKICDAMGDLTIWRNVIGHSPELEQEVGRWSGWSANLHTACEWPQDIPVEKTGALESRYSSFSFRWNMITGL